MKGLEQLSEHDLAVVLEFQTFLERCGAAGYPANSLHHVFDADMATVCNTMMTTDRESFVIVAGQLQVAL